MRSLSKRIVKRGRRLYVFDGRFYIRHQSRGITSLFAVRPKRGDYWRGTDGVWVFFSPKGPGAITGGVVQEHQDDHTITVKPRVSVTVDPLSARSKGAVWEGHIERGFWRGIGKNEKNKSTP